MERKKYIIHTDGGSRGNPGEAAIGVLITDDSQNEYQISEKIGITTNNIAEYTALVKALLWLNEKTGTCEVDAEFFLDSELVVKQINGQYKVKDEKIKVLFDQVKKLLSPLSSSKFTHVLRAQNKIADKLVNQALDSNVT
jgi:ribonuclease HI